MQFAFKRMFFASTNKGKLIEVQEVASKFAITVLGTEVIQIEKKLNAPPVVEETALIYEDNARLKAEALFNWSCGMPTLADDSGLEVEALGGLPGVNTSRYAGISASSEQNISKLLNELITAKNRKAKFVCCLYLKLAENEILTARAEFPGIIAAKAFGNGGFGYDPVFIPEGFTKSLAELKGEGSNIRTHRILALEALFNQLRI